MELGQAVGLENKETLPTSTAFGHGSSWKQHQWEQAAPRRGSGLRWEDFDLPRTGGTEERVPGAELQ